MEELQSFHVAEGDQFGDLVSRDRIRSSEGIKIGLISLIVTIIILA